MVTKQASIEEELVRSVGKRLKKVDKTDRVGFVEALFHAIIALDGEEWDALSDEAQDWFNDNAVRFKTNKGVKDPDLLLSFIDPATGEEVVSGEEEVLGADEDEEEVRVRLVGLSDDDEEEEEDEKVTTSTTKRGRHTMAPKTVVKKKADSKIAPKPSQREISISPEPKVKKEKKEKAPLRPKKPSFREILKKMIIKNENITEDQLSAEVAKMGLSPRKGTVKYNLGDAKLTLRLIREEGWVKK